MRRNANFCVTIELLKMNNDAKLLNIIIAKITVSSLSAFLPLCYPGMERKR